MTDILNRQLLPSPDTVESAVGDETVILHLANATYYGLDAVGTRIWALIKDGMALPTICTQLAEEYGVEQTTVEEDARRFVSDLEAQGILIDG